MRRYATQAGQAASHFRAAIRETTAPRQAHTLEQFRQAPAPGAVRFVVMNTDFLAGLAPQLLAGGRVILMMPAATAGSDARYRMRQSLHQAVRDELHCCIAGLLTIHDPARQPAWPGPGCATPKACSLSSTAAMKVLPSTVASTAAAPSEDAPAVARKVGLRYVDDSRPGIARRKTRTGFRYLGPDGSPVRDEETLARIRALAIPPAWTDVWICPLASGHIQATGRDARKRKQYRYHAQWRSVRDESKYERMLSFGRALPRIRARINEDLSLPGLPREKVLATVVQLLQDTMIRVGNEEYARTNKSFGLTTLRNRHVDVSAREVEFHFRGKSGVEHRIRLRDPKLARIIRRMRDLPGQELFQYVDADGERHSIDSADVNDYLRSLTGEDYTAKDFRTWSGTMLAALELQALRAGGSQADAKKNIVQAIASVSRRLGNTPAVCRKCYVHPAVLDCYLQGIMHEAWDELVKSMEIPADDPHALKTEELAVLALLERRSEAGQESARQKAAGSERAAVDRAGAADRRRLAR